MGILNRRNALLGWLVWFAVKVVTKSKVKSAGPGSRRSYGISAAVFALAAGTGAAWLFLRRRGHEDSSPGE